MNCKTIKIQRFQKNKVFYMEDQLLVEQQLQLYKNDHFICTITCTPVQVEDLIIGILFFEKIITCFEDVEKIYKKENKIFAVVKIKKHKENPMCGSEDSPNFLLQYEKLLPIFEKFNEGSDLFRKTGGIHSVILLNGEYELLYRSEDMGRHNAVDKAIGYCIKNKINTSQIILMASSRMPLEIIEKCHKGGILAVGSISAPTMQSLEFARRNSMNLVGMYRNNRFNIYSVSQIGEQNGK